MLPHFPALSPRPALPERQRETPSMGDKSDLATSKEVRFFSSSCALIPSLGGHR
jgi:hypothetical protein